MEHDGYAKLVSDAAGLALAVEDAVNQTPPRAVNDLLATQLPQLEAVTQRLANAPPPADATAAHDRLVAGLRTFEDDLMAVQEEATLAASAGDVYQSGLLRPSMSVVEGGGRMRWELAQSRGLAEVRFALAELKTVGLTDSRLNG